jgi:hypothetical protein
VAEIPNFPEDLLHLHHAWHRHSEHPELPSRQYQAGEPGSGSEFLMFHRDFVRKFHLWYDTQPFADRAGVAPWTKIPTEMKLSLLWDPANAERERRILTNDPAYADFDELGINIETGIHDIFLHTAAGDVYGDNLIPNPATAPRSTLFYKIHGLVGHWWRLRFPGSVQLQSSVSKADIDALPKHPPLPRDETVKVDVPPKHPPL